MPNATFTRLSLHRIPLGVFKDFRARDPDPDHTPDYEWWQVDMPMGQFYLVSHGPSAVSYVRRADGTPPSGDELNTVCSEFFAMVEESEGFFAAAKRHMEAQQAAPQTRIWRSLGIGLVIGFALYIVFLI